MTAIVIGPQAGAGRAARLVAGLRGRIARLVRRLPAFLNGLETVELEGRVLIVRAVPLGVARNMVPALVRCSQAFAAWRFDEALYDDLITTLALGLGLARARVENLRIALWELGPVVEAIARANGLPVMEAGRSAPGKPMPTSTGTPSTPGSSAPPAGPGSTSTDA